MGHPTSGAYFQDDLAGLFQTDTVVNGQPLHLEIPYIGDQDGDPSGGVFTASSPTSIVGVYFLGASQPLAKTSFNWWTPNGNIDLDWGPQLAPGRLNQSGGRGQPEGDKMKYYCLSNGEKDYDQVTSALNQTTAGWLPPLTPQGNAIDIANGYDTRYLYTIGPFDLAPAETLSFSISLLAGTGFHNNPQNFSQNLGATIANYLNPAKIEAYQQGLDFSDLISKALAARQKAGLMQPIRGDINGDFLLTTADVVTLLNIVFLGTPPPTFPEHDMNCDGLATAADVVLLLNYIFLDVALPC